MPYLEPEHVLREFSRYAVAEVRPAIDEDEAFMRGQVGSMASTLRFLAGEIEGREGAIETQRTALLDALEATEEVVGDPAVLDALADARRRVADADGEPRAIEGAILGAADDALAAVDGLDDETARAARTPLYTFLDARLEAQHRLLGRSAPDG